MINYSYQAIDRTGQLVSGEIQGGSPAEVTGQLQADGFRVFDVHEATAVQGFFRTGQSITVEHLHLFNEQLLAIMRSGLPLPSGIKSLAVEVNDSAFASALEKIAGSIERGTSLSEALSGAGAVFPAVYLNTIRAGERTGNLPAVLALLTDYSRKMLEFRGGLQSALSYPFIVSVMALAIFGFLCSAVSPVLRDLYSNVGAELSLPSRICVALGNFINQNTGAFIGLFLTLALIAAACFVLIRRNYGFDNGLTRTLQRALTTLPYIGPLFRAAALGRFAYSLETLLKSRCPVAESLALAGAASGNLAMRDACVSAADKVASGERVSDALSNVPFLKSSLLWLLSQGEQRGVLEQSVRNMAESCDREVDRRSKMVVRLSAPFSLLFIGAGVLFAAYSILIPIFRFASLIN